MNDTQLFPQMVRPAGPDLPTPVRLRWQPLRIGLVDLYLYDSEEFWFRDGHLLLRGNNGTGKSKVLSLTLPFLLDARINPSRIEPDGDSNKKMAWNLLLGRHDRRMGYAWIELGRLSESGQPQYLTLGAGLLAVAARPQVDSWFFVLEDRRIGADLWLTSPQQVVLTRERLKEALGDRGQIFDTAVAYRRAVDERLFRLGAVRYEALMDTLIQLRQPQLSRKPDEASLSDALTEALPPLPAELLGDVADALNQLEEDRRQLDDYESLARAVGQFTARYRVYARTQARRQSRQLRSAQTGFDTASRTLNEARAALDEARLADRRAEIDEQAADNTLRAARERLATLQADPAMQDANRLAAAETDAARRHRDADAAEQALQDARRRHGRESAATAERLSQTAAAEQSVAAMRMPALRLARATGLEAAYAANALAAAQSAALASFEASEVDQAYGELRRHVVSRREQVGLVRRRREETDRADRDRAAQESVRDQRRDERDAVAAQRDEADRTVLQSGRALVDAWQAHFEKLVQLRVAQALPALESLALWVSTLEGDNPAREALQSAQQEASERLATRLAGLAAQQEALKAEQDSLEAERERLHQGEDAVPPIPFWRAPDAREGGRAGAPFWQLVDFRTEVGEPERAGLEAALEASGLLDAWVTPDGSLDLGDGRPPLHDTALQVRPGNNSSLAAWLRPCGEAIDAEIVARLLAGIACTPQDDGEAESWLAVDGRFRLGALAGAWGKPAAAFIGHAARAAARTRRREAIEQRLRQIESEQAGLQAHFAALARERADAAAEWQDAPRDDALRGAHADAAASARAWQAAGERLDEAERLLEAATREFRSCRDCLARDAQDLRLPSTLEALQAVEQDLAAFGEALLALLQAVRELCRAQHELELQRGREREAEDDAQRGAQERQRRNAEAEEAAARLETLREAIGARVGELYQRLAAARAGVEDGERLLRSQRETRRLAGEARARCEERAQAAEDALLERNGTRQAAIEHLQSFAATGLLSVALPEAEIPDLASPWTIEPALTLARRTEQALVATDDSEDAWTRIQSQLSQDYGELGRNLTALGQQSHGETTDYGLVVRIVYRNRPEPPDRLDSMLAEEIAQRRELLTAREREVLENHLQAEIAAAIQKLLQEGERHVDQINRELAKRPTSTGVRFRLQWQPLPEGADGAPVGLEAARRRLLNTNADLWSAEDRRVVGVMLQQRIETERAAADADHGGSLLEQLARALDYRRWHRFAVQRWQDGQWRRLSGPASSGERALGLTVPLFAAVASFYSQSAYAYSPRLVLLDEAFAGIDDAARAHCMGLIREFDLDFVITSEREWGCYAELPGVAICQLQRREGIDAVHVSRWTWDGRARAPQTDPDRRFPVHERQP